MASTSLVCVLSAITDGSLSTMPSPLAYTSVFAVPRSMARSRATGGAAPGYSGSTAGDSPWPVGALVSLGAPRSRRGGPPGGAGGRGRGRGGGAGAGGPRPDRCGGDLVDVGLLSPQLGVGRGEGLQLAVERLHARLHGAG